MGGGGGHEKRGEGAGIGDGRNASSWYTRRSREKTVPHYLVYRNRSLHRMVLYYNPYQNRTKTVSCHTVMTCVACLVILYRNRSAVS